MGNESVVRACNHGPSGTELMGGHHACESVCNVALKVRLSPGDPQRPMRRINRQAVCTP